MRNTAETTERRLFRCKQMKKNPTLPEKGRVGAKD
jgi:hypothetical protein